MTSDSKHKYSTIMLQFLPISALQSCPKASAGTNTERTQAGHSLIFSFMIFKKIQNLYVNFKCGPPRGTAPGAGSCFPSVQGFPLNSVKSTVHSLGICHGASPVLH